MSVDPEALRYRKDGPMCPTCGEVTQACDAHYYDEDWTHGTCGHCGAPFYVEVHHLGHRWTTRPKDA